MRDNQSWLEAGVAQCLLHGLGHQADKVRSDEPADGRADDDREQRVYDAFTELDEVLEKRHLSAGLFLGWHDRGVRLAAVGHERGVEQVRAKARQSVPRTLAGMLRQLLAPGRFRSVELTPQPE